MRLPHPARSGHTNDPRHKAGDGPREPLGEAEGEGGIDAPRASRLRSDAFLKDAMDRWGDIVYRVALAQTGSPSDADDVFQDAFIRLLKDETPFQSDEHVKAWLLRVTINRCHDLARSGWNRNTTPLALQHTQLAAPNAFRADIWEVVGQLPPDMRAVVHLHYVEGYSTGEIAAIMGCKPGTVRTRLHRARERLRLDLLADQADNAGGSAPDALDAEQPASARGAALPPAPHQPPSREHPSLPERKALSNEGAPPPVGKEMTDARAAHQPKHGRLPLHDVLNACS